MYSDGRILIWQAFVLYDFAIIWPLALKCETTDFTENMGMSNIFD